MLPALLKKLKTIRSKFVSSGAAYSLKALEMWTFILYIRERQKCQWALRCQGRENSLFFTKLTTKLESDSIHKSFQSLARSTPIIIACNSASKAKYIERGWEKQPLTKALQFLKIPSQARRALSRLVSIQFNPIKVRRELI